MPSPTPKCFPRSPPFSLRDTKRPHQRSHGHFMLSHVRPLHRHDCVSHSVPAIQQISMLCSSCHSSTTPCARPSVYTRQLAAQCVSTPARHPNVSCPSSTLSRCECRPGVASPFGSETTAAPLQIKQRRTADGTYKAVSISVMATSSPSPFKRSIVRPTSGAPMPEISDQNDGPIYPPP